MARHGLLRVRISFALLLACLSVLPQGCLSTVRVNQYIGKNSYPGFEISTRIGVYQGEYVGIERRLGRRSVGLRQSSGVDFYHYQFAGLLEGPVPRYLQLYLPVPPDNTYMGILEESKVPLDMRSQGAALFVVGETRRVLAGNDVKSVLAARYGVPRTGWSKQPVLIEWRGDQDPAANVVCYADDGPYPMQSIADGHLDRIQRSRLRPVLGSLLYLVSVPFDIATFPVQAIIWLRAGGPG